MKYDTILIRYGGEMTTKGKNRNRFTDILKENIKYKLKKFQALEYEVTRDRMYIKLNGEDHEAVSERLLDIFGIHNFSLAMKVETDLEAMKRAALSAFLQVKRRVKTFKVSVHRPFKQFPMDTNQLNREIGAHILRNTEDITVDVRTPDVNVRVEVREGHTYVMCEDRPGAGGLPVGIGGKVMLMLSGGIDSPVAGYLTMKRGVTLEAVHFHSPPFTSERAKQKVVDLAQELTKYCRKVTLHVVPFTELQKAIQKQVPDTYTMTVMRRMMLQIAERIAEQRGALAVVTGESLGQVASQTLDSMHAINEVTNYPVLRPLITMDKLEIMKIAHDIGTYTTSIQPYEDCCTIFTPPNPTTKPSRRKVNRYESFFDFEPLLAEAVEQTERILLKWEEKEAQVEEEFKDLF
ncbi:tRNA uracil 4-sulfurtransferase ThiI [Ectobacillus ponti]|uniref:Probable tRNA sulfurtransferase n=1 Tax=Ectobacillus ponti TaxID=2961894 RepID=A0AA41X708_9BACI|nr:tRNA uracil 4-sulfurtransferase ThiI [Ectobacillus ponti]MCP8967463.1 tRNA 4-thiouridine(8) synthase ThiI [Ectobacillus ponti]